MSKNIKKKVLESLAKEGTLFCKKHSYDITPKELYKKKCWATRGKTKYCEYILIKK